MKEIESSDLLDFKEKLSLIKTGEDQEKGAIFMINMNNSGNQNTGFLALIADDDFYHLRPFDKKSILYLLVRFIGDLTADIILLYDNQMNLDFKNKGCPYAYVEQQILELQMVERSIKDVNMREIKCDYGLLEFDEKYRTKIEVSVPLSTKTILLLEQSLIKDIKERIILQAKNQEKLLNKIFKMILMIL